MAELVEFRGSADADVFQGKSLEQMDAVFGDTTAHEEKARLFAIASSLGLREAEAAAQDVKGEKALHAETSEL